MTCNGLSARRDCVRAIAGPGRRPPARRVERAAGLRARDRGAGFLVDGGPVRSVIDARTSTGSAWCIRGEIGMDAQTTGWMARIRTACVTFFGSGDRRARDPGARAAALELEPRGRDG